MTVAELIVKLLDLPRDSHVRIQIKNRVANDSADADFIREDRYWYGHKDQDEPCVLIVGSGDRELEN